jgi:hypothetical protein
MNRFLAAALTVLALTSASNADMSDRMYSATHAFKATAMIASEYQKCGFDSSRLRDAMIEWASTACHASGDEIAGLRQAYDDELKDITGTLRWRFHRCQWSPEQTQTEFQADRARVEKFTKSPCQQ